MIQWCWIIRLEPGPVEVGVIPAMQIHDEIAPLFPLERNVFTASLRELKRYGTIFISANDGSTLAEGILMATRATLKKFENRHAVTLEVDGREKLLTPR